MRRFLRFVAAATLVLGLSGCVELLDLVQIISYEESDDPNLQSLGRLMNEFEKEKQASKALDDYALTGDPRHLEAARELQPDNIRLAAYDLIIAEQSGDPSAISGAQDQLALSSARDLKTTNSSQAPTADAVRRNALESVILAQVQFYGTTVWDPIAPPPPGSDPQRIRLFESMCANHADIRQLGTEYSALTEACA